MNGENGHAMEATAAPASQVIQQFTVTGVEHDESPTLAAFAAALAKAQGAMGAAKKTNTNPHFGSKFADLADVWGVIREPLSTNGIAVVQRVSNVDAGVCITTMLLHASGEWMRDRLVVPIVKNDAQAIGSAITYGRRYALSSMVGVAADGDDDGNAAARAGNSGGRYTPSADAEGKKQTKTDKTKEKLAEQKGAETTAATDKLAPWGRILELCAKHGKSAKEAGSITKGATSKSRPGELNDADVALVQAALEAMAKMPAPAAAAAEGGAQ